MGEKAERNRSEREGQEKWGRKQREMGARGEGRKRRGGGKKERNGGRDRRGKKGREYDASTGSTIPVGPSEAVRASKRLKERKRKRKSGENGQE